jgi:hypothetical protein
MSPKIIHEKVISCYGEKKRERERQRERETERERDPVVKWEMLV